VGQNLHRRSIDHLVPAPAALVGEPPRVANARHDQAVANAPRPLLVQGQPGDGADGARHEEETVGVSKRDLPEQASEVGRQHHAGEVVVGQGRVAAVGGDQDFVGQSTGDHDLAVRERSLGQGGVDQHVVIARPQARALLVTEAEAQSSL
jgi:hypothetical protein